tara:strand:- start:415 stop:690 length:276 start_codon:yes stop_codon:yes gene_type:complete
MTLIDLHKNWKDHDIVTDTMANKLKTLCGCKPYEGLMDVSKDDHERILGPIPEGAVVWIKIDRRLPRMTGYCLNISNVVYTTPYGHKIIEH